jgi:regulator of sigma E protease
MSVLHTIFYFLIAIGILVYFHEFGHFWVARKLGVKVLRFSIGFGKVLWSYQKTPGSTEYVLSAIPLGGYVKMLDEREGEVLPEDMPYSFNQQPVLARSAIVLAGPVFNLMLAVVFFWAVLVIGEKGFKPIIGAVAGNTIAAKAGFVQGDEIISVNEKLTPTWNEAISTIITEALDGRELLDISVKDRDEQQGIKTLVFTEDDTRSPDLLLKRLGFKPWTPDLKPVIGQILPGSAALQAGLHQGDLILSADGKAMPAWSQLVEYIKVRAGIPIKLMVERDGVNLPIMVTPATVKDENNTTGKIGAGVFVPEALINAVSVDYRLPPLAAIPVAIKTTWYYSSMTLKMMGKMLAGRASVENLSGPISIAQYAGQSADRGMVHFIKFLAMVSVSLGVLNLLPIPILDGGHLLFFAIEGIKGSPVSEKFQFFVQQIGAVLLVLLMLLAMYLDVERWMP